MQRTRSILRQPVEPACRQVALAQTDMIAKAAARLGDQNDAEALHDFRVSVRRLRSILRQYAPHLDKRLSKKLRKQLGKLTDATNAGRDLEVHVAWLRGRLAKLRPSKLPGAGAGIRVLLDELETQSTEAAMPKANELQQRFAKLEAKLRRRLARDAGRPSGTNFAAATGRVVEDLRRKLADDLASIATMDDQAAIHRSRLTAKRLRYVIEPIQKKLPGGRASVRRLKRLQDILGDLHDLQTLHQRIDASMQREAVAWAKQLADGQPGAAPTHACRALAAVVKTLRRDQSRLFTRLQRRWLGEQAKPFFDLVERVANVLCQPPPRRTTPPSDASPPAHRAQNS